MKRVELHCHTKMSDMDGVSEVWGPRETGEKVGDAGIGGNGSWLCPGVPGREPRLDKGDTFKVLYGLRGTLSMI